MNRYWNRFKNFCSDNWFGVTCVAIGLAGFAVALAVVIFFPPALPAIVAWAPFAGVQVFGFVGALAAASIPAAAAAFGATCTAALLVAGGIFRTIVAGFNAITRSAQEDKKERTLAFAANTKDGHDLAGNPISPKQRAVLLQLSNGKVDKTKPESELSAPQTFGNPIDVDGTKMGSKPKRRGVQQPHDVVVVSSQEPAVAFGK